MQTNRVSIFVYFYTTTNYPLLLYRRVTQLNSVNRIEMKLDRAGWGIDLHSWIEDSGDWSIINSPLRVERRDESEERKRSWIKRREVCQTRFEIEWINSEYYLGRACEHELQRLMKLIEKIPSRDHKGTLASEESLIVFEVIVPEGEGYGS